MRKSLCLTSVTIIFVGVNRVIQQNNRNKQGNKNTMSNQGECLGFVIVESVRTALNFNESEAT